MASYQVVLRDPFGNQQDVISSFIKLDYVRKENEVGVLNLTIPRSNTERYFAKDARLEVWRTIGSKTYLDAQSVWFLRNWTLIRNGREQTWRLTAFDGNYLLSGREVEYAAESAYASKTDQIDDMMKAILRENLGSSATDAARSISSYLACQADTSLAPSTTKKFSRRNVLDIFNELAEESYQRGTYLAFDVQWSGPNTLEFRTFVNALGFNHGRASGNPVVVNEARGSLVDPVLDFDYSNEITAAVAGGTGTEADRAVYAIVDAVRAVETPFSRREKFVNAVQSGATAAALESEARSALNSGRPKITLTGSVQDTSGLMYGIDYGYGDIIVAEHEGYSFDAHLDRVHVTVTKDGEVLDNRVRGAI